IFNYPVLWAAGDTDLTGKMQPLVEEYLKRGGTLVVNIAAAGKLPEKIMGLKVAGKTVVAEKWTPADGKNRLAPPFELVLAGVAGAKEMARAEWDGKPVPLITRHHVGAGAVIVTLIPHMLGQDERAHPALPYLLNGLTANLLRVEVRLANGKKLNGEIMYQVNKTKDGYLVALFNQQGIDKTQTG